MRPRLLQPALPVPHTPPYCASVASVCFPPYVTNYLDRTSVAYAAIGMARDLGFDDRVFGLGIGISSSAMWPCKYRARCWSNDGARAGCFAPR